MPRCPITMGKGSLACCRVAEHRTDNGPAVHNGCCLHSTLLGPMAGPHQQHTRVGAGHPLTCNTGTALDGG